MAAQKGPSRPMAPGMVNERRVTRQRSIVAEALGRERVAVSAQELHERIRATHQRIGLATVYRALDAQVADGLATRLERDGHVYVYAACAPEHHHHLVCTRCQRVADLDESLLRPVLRSVRARHGFAVDHARLDFYGECERCRSRTSSSSGASAASDAKEKSRPRGPASPPPTGSGPAPPRRASSPVR